MPLAPHVFACGITSGTTRGLSARRGGIHGPNDRAVRGGAPRHGRCRLLADRGRGTVTPAGLPIAAPAASWAAA